MGVHWADPGGNVPLAWGHLTRVSEISADRSSTERRVSPTQSYFSGPTVCRNASDSSKKLRYTFSPMKLITTLALAFSFNAFAFEALPDKPPIPEGNPQSPAKIELGKQLYFDTRLSRTGTISCNSCHDVMKGGVDNQQFSTGVDGQKGGRNSPTVWNAAFHSVQFWDGRAPSLEEQAKGPIVNPVEMGMANHDAVVAVVKKVPGYESQFKKVFGGPDPVTIDNIAKAIASYERTLITPKSKVDRYLKGDKNALNAQELRGMKLAETVGCVTCHSGPNFAGPALPEGTGFYQKFPMFPGSEYEKKYGFTKDAGRFEATKEERDRGFFRVPTWRNVALTGPYFHNGSVEKLDEAVRVMAKTQLNKTLPEPQVQDIVAFLTALNGAASCSAVVQWTITRLGLLSSADAPNTRAIRLLSTLKRRKRLIYNLGLLLISPT